jgi:ADP-ribose pyrophosphatase YjhB (NUDIX family)
MRSSTPSSSFFGLAHAGIVRGHHLLVFFLERSAATDLTSGRSSGSAHREIERQEAVELAAARVANIFAHAEHAEVRFVGETDFSRLAPENDARL